MTSGKNICRICHGDFSGYAMGEKNGYRFLACNACGSVVTQPWPAQADIDQFLADIQPEIVHLPEPEREIKKKKKIILARRRSALPRRFLPSGLWRDGGKGAGL